jgi:hypothetical protein
MPSTSTKKPLRASAGTDMTTTPKLPEGLEPVAWRVDWPLDLIDAIAPDRFYDASDAHRMNCHLSYVQGVGPVPEPLYTAAQMREAILAATERANDDTARLDWIVRQSDEFSCSLIMDAPGDGEYIVHGMDGYGQGKTPREAIDNAMRFNAAASTGRGEGGEGA